MEINNVEILDFGKYAFNGYERMLAYYKYAEYVLAMRGHGQIVPIGFNVPVVSLHNHPKHLGLMKKLNLEMYNVDVTDKNFIKRLEEVVAVIENNRLHVVNRYKILNKQLMEQSAQAMQDIKAAIQ